MCATSRGFDWLMALAARTGRHPSTHFAPEMRAEDVECINRGHGWHTIHFPDREGLAKYIHVHVSVGVLAVWGHTATFHDAVGACPPLTLSEDEVGTRSPESTTGRTSSDLVTGQKRPRQEES